MLSRTERALGRYAEPLTPRAYAVPQTVSVDEDPSILHRGCEEHGIALRIGEAKDLNLATGRGGQAVREGGRSLRPPVRESDEEVDVAIRVGVPARGRAVEHAQADVRLGAKRTAQRADKRPMAASVNDLPGADRLAPGSHAANPERAVVCGATQGPASGPELPGQMI